MSNLKLDQTEELQEVLYHHILNIQGIKHASIDYTALVATKDYIKKELISYGLEVRDSEFYCDGFDKPFFNIEGSLGKRNDLKQLLLVSHYDTVSNSPGANDNGSGTAVMLELARRLKPFESQLNVKFLFFTLEECNPTVEHVRITEGERLGIYDLKGNFSRLLYLKDSQLFRATYQKINQDHRMLPYGEKYKRTLETVKSSISGPMQTFYGALYNCVSTFKDPLGFGENALIGSHRWVMANKVGLQDVIGVIDLDSVGYARTDVNSHKGDMNMLPFEFDSFGVDLEKKIGNFITFICNQGALFLKGTFDNKARLTQLPYYSLICPLQYEDTVANCPELLYADHAIFWKEDVPCLFITDTGGEMRYPFEHTPADTIEKLDFHFLSKIVQVVEASIIEIYKKEGV
jgi:hypothetical protein